MKHTKLIFGLLVVLTTMLSWWTVPALVRKMTDSANPYPLVYYSSVLKELCLIDFRDNKQSFFDVKGKEYPRTKYDEYLPLLNFRQLMMNNAMPDSLEGHAIDMRTMRMKQVSFRQQPIKVFSPQPPMGVLLEAMPKRMNLTLPGDYFRMGSSIEFVDATTNTINEEKSARFTNELNRKGFAFPAQNFWGNPTTRKPYEEGYFCLDSKGQLFHLKMVNGRPFVKNTGIGNQLEIEWFSMMEVMDKRFYGFLFGKHGEVGILESTEEGGYHFLPMNIRPFNIHEEELVVLGNLLYWTVRIDNQEGIDCYGMKADTFETLSTYHQDRNQTLWDKTSKWLFTCQISPVSTNCGYISLYVSDFSAKALLINAILALIYFLTRKKNISLSQKGLVTFYLFLTGIPGLIALAFLPSFENK